MWISPSSECSENNFPQRTVPILSKFSEMPGNRGYSSGNKYPPGQPVYRRLFHFTYRYETGSIIFVVHQSSLFSSQHPYRVDATWSLIPKSRRTRGYRQATRWSSSTYNLPRYRSTTFGPIAKRTRWRSRCIRCSWLAGTSVSIVISRQS